VEREKELGMVMNVKGNEMEVREMVYQKTKDYK
jgi:hypothetical protein